MRWIGETRAQVNQTVRIASGLILALMASSCGRSGSHDPEMTAGAPNYRVTAQAQLDSASEVRSLSFERDGLIESVLVRPGQTVVMGQPLAQIRCDDVIAAKDQASAEARFAKAQLALVREGPRAEEIAAAHDKVLSMEARSASAHDLASRTAKLSKSGAVSQRDAYDAARAYDAIEAERLSAEQAFLALAKGSRPKEREAAAAKFEAAKASAALQAANAEKCTLRSPVAGEILRVLKREGEFSAASLGATAMTVADTTHLIARTELDERDAAEVGVGDCADIWFDGSKRRFQGRVVEVSNQMGRKFVRSFDPADRFDRDVREVLVSISDSRMPQLIGMRLTVGFRACQRHN